MNGRKISKRQVLENRHKSEENEQYWIGYFGKQITENWRRKIFPGKQRQDYTKPIVTCKRENGGGKNLPYNNYKVSDTVSVSYI